MLTIAFPEFSHPAIQEAIASHPEITALEAPDLATACAMVKSGAADTMIAGIDYSSRDVILACRDHFAMATSPATNLPYHSFSGLAVMQNSMQKQCKNPCKKANTYLLADMAACKHPTSAQLCEIIEQTAASARKILPDEPRVALLSFSTNGSGGHDSTIDLIHETIAAFSGRNLKIAGEMQLDAAINPVIGAKKFPGSTVAGHANVLIAPDLNSGNLLYKSFEQLAGFTVAGPILQGFEFPVSDLSRGSTAADISWTIEVLTKLLA